jgi:hypothetical protein
MRLLLVLALVALAGGCNSAGNAVSDAGASLNSGLGTNIGRGVDPYGTQRRPDVYYGSTRPSLPTIGNR